MMESLTVPEAARALGVRMNYIRVLLAEGLLRGRKDARGRWLIEAESVDSYRERQFGRRGHPGLETLK